MEPVIRLKNTFDLFWESKFGSLNDQGRVTRCHCLDIVMQYVG